MKMYPFVGFVYENKGNLVLHLLRTFIIKGNYKDASIPYYTLVSVAIRENAKISGISISESAWDLRRRLNPFGELNISYS